jgi:hypothetical protein|tara:strand:- start:2284 stop:2532 length:249 start_codon:yes stop_codon:yes gene_type:complete
MAHIKGKLLDSRRRIDENRKAGFGGKRKGAGRPPLHGGRLVQKTINIPPALAEVIEAYAVKNGRSVPKEIVAWLHEELQRKV